MDDVCGRRELRHPWCRRCQGIRAYARSGLTLEEGPFFKSNVYLWLPEVSPRQTLFQARYGSRVEEFSNRSHYYTSLVGSHDDIASTKHSIRDIGFHPEVFKRAKNQTKAKGVDIAITRDLLVHAFRGNYDVAVIVAGDADYVPVMAELKRLGVLVHVWFFRHPAAGDVDAVWQEADKFFDITDTFCQRWRDYLLGQRSDSKSPES